MHSMGSPNYEYRPWTWERRRAASSNAKDRLDGIFVPRALKGREQARLNREKLDKIFNDPKNLWNYGLAVPAIRAPTPPKILLAYPYIIKKRDEHADLLAVNSLVPRGLEGREDVCQEIMLALWQQRITIDQLKANRSDVRGFVRAFKRGNFESSGYAISLDAPRADGRSWHDILAADETAG